MANKKPTIDQIRGMGDFADLIHWSLDFVKFPEKVDSLPSSEDLNLRCISAEVPKITTEMMTINIRGHETFQVGRNKPQGPITLTFIETVDNTLVKFISDWRKKCADMATGEMEDTKDIEAVVSLTRMNRKNEEIYEYTLYGCIISDSDPGGQLVDQSTEALKPTIQLTYTHFEEKSLI